MSRVRMFVCSNKEQNDMAKKDDITNKKDGITKRKTMVAELAQLVKVPIAYRATCVR